MQELVGLAEDARRARSSGQLAAQRVLGKPPDEVARVVAQHGHALAERVERRDHDRADLTRFDREPGVGVDNLDQAHVEIVMEVSRAARATADGKHLRHRERVVHDRAQGLDRCGGERSRQQLAAAVDPPQPEGVGAETAPAGGAHKLGEIARIGGEERGRDRAGAAQAVEALLGRHEAENRAARADDNHVP